MLSKMVSLESERGTYSVMPMGKMLSETASFQLTKSDSLTIHVNSALSEITPYKSKQLNFQALQFFVGEIIVPETCPHGNEAIE